MNRALQPFSLLSIMVILMLLVSGCGQGSTTAPEVQPAQVTDAPESVGLDPTPETFVTARPLSLPPSSGGGSASVAVLPADPQLVSFTASDGTALNGIYYPAAVNSAPIIVLMHWAGGNMHDWDAIAPWLQNRGLPGPTNPEYPWLDSSWFPVLSEGESYAVFVFNFRGFENGDGAFDPEGWLMDAQAAMATARTLEGVDPQRVIAMGASIGADGAPDACAEGCLGTLSLSPGSYLGVPYNQAVEALINVEPPREVWCLAGDQDTPSALACQSAEDLLSEHVFVNLYPGENHGMNLIQPDIEPYALQYMLDFVHLVLGS